MQALLDTLVELLISYLGRFILHQITLYLYSKLPLSFYMIQILIFSIYMLYTLPLIVCF